MKTKSILVALVAFFSVVNGGANAAGCCTQPSAAQAERDKIYGLTALAVIYKNWQNSSGTRGHNIGSVLVRNSANASEIIPVFYARNSVDIRHNSSQHGEVRMIQGFLDFCQTYNPKKYVDGFTLYTTLEPCAMCTGMMAMTKLSRAVYVQVDPEFGNALRGLQLVRFPRVFMQNTTPGLQQKIDLEAGWVGYRTQNPGSAITDYLKTENARAVYASAEQAIINFNIIYPENGAVKLAAISFLNRVDNGEVFDGAMAARCPQ